DDANSTGDLDVRAGMSIYGASGVTIDANANDRVFDVDPAASAAVGLALADVKLTGGKVSGDGGAIRARLKAFLDLDHVVVDGVQASGDGGAISTVSKGRMQATTIKGAAALGDGGGLDLPGAAFEVRDSTIAGNSAEGDGGAVSVAASGGRVAVVNSTIS